MRKYVESQIDAHARAPLAPEEKAEEDEFSRQARLEREDMERRIKREKVEAFQRKKLAIRRRKQEEEQKRKAEGEREHKERLDKEIQDRKDKRKEFLELKKKILQEKFDKEHIEEHLAVVAGVPRPLDPVALIALEVEKKRAEALAKGGRFVKQKRDKEEEEAEKKIKETKMKEEADAKAVGLTEEEKAEQEVTKKRLEDYRQAQLEHEKMLKVVEFEKDLKKPHRVYRRMSGVPNDILISEAVLASLAEKVEKNQDSRDGDSGRSKAPRGRGRTEEGGGKGVERRNQI